MAVQTPYVEYIKIARTDELGQDLTPTLEALTQIKLPFTNGVSRTYRIVSTTRYNDYFLFGISRTGASAPLAADASNLDYNFTSSLPTSVNNFVAVPGSQTLYPTSTTGPNTQLFNTVPTSGYNSVGAGGDGGMYYGNGIILKTYPTTQIEAGFNITASVTTGQFTFRLYRIINGVLESLLQESALITTGTTSLTISTTTTTGEMGVNDGFSLFAYNGAAPSSPANEVNFTFSSTSNFFASSSTTSGPTLETIPEPYLTSQFEGTDCDVLLNNEETYIENPFLQDIDYSGNPFVPVNFNLLLSGSAAKGTVPASYYTALSQTNIRYTGVKNQSSDVNIYNPQAGTSSFGDPINIGTYGQTPSVDSLDADIYEFEWGGGTTPEILGFGAISLGNILQVNSPNLVKIINPSNNFEVKHVLPNIGVFGQVYNDTSEVTTIFSSPDDLYRIGRTTSSFFNYSDYYQILNSNNKVNHRINMSLYPNPTGAQPTLPKSTKILTTDFGVPTKSNYFLPAFATRTLTDGTTYGQPAVWFGVTTSGGNLEERFQALSFRSFSGEYPRIPVVNTDSNGAYITSSTQYFNPEDIITSGSIVNDLNNGERWFVTVFENATTPLNNDIIIPYTGSLNGAGYNIIPSNENKEFENILAERGVYEIIGAKSILNFNDDGYNAISLILNPTFVPFSRKTTTIGFANYGCLIWKAKQAGKNKFVIVQDEITGGASNGAFTSKYSPEYLTENFQKITREYGSNTSG